MTGKYLSKLVQGDNRTTLSSCCNDRLPDEFDLNKFRQGQKFFQKNIAACLLAMLCSLVIGMSVTDLLDPLAFTEKSDTPKKSLIRYLKTMMYVVQWHCGNIWDVNSNARKSIQTVCSLHDNTRTNMMKKAENKKLYVSQYDMSLVQSGFIGAIIMYPKQFGIRADRQELEDYVYFWRWIGYLLGIEDCNNICKNSLDESIAICHEIEDIIVYPALQKPPPKFHLMAKAFTDGTNLLHKFKLFTPESIISFGLDRTGKKRINYSFVDRFRILFLKAVVDLLYYCSGFRYLINIAFINLCKSVEQKNRLQYINP